VSNLCEFNSHHLAQSKFMSDKSVQNVQEQICNQ